ncbi:MAG: helicase associated domain-containing protein [Bacteroidales bacterium]|nr:helicase associated domain-containing protein [Bacteroidales bacterium]
MTKFDEAWMKKYEELKEHVRVYGHFPPKNTPLNNWVKYQRKLINKGKIREERKELFIELAESRRLWEHVGGRRKKKAANPE